MVVAAPALIPLAVSSALWLLLLPLALAASAGLAAVAARLLWNEPPRRGLLWVVHAAALATAAGALAFLAHHLITVNEGLCARDDSSSIPTGAAIAMACCYVVVGAWAFQKPRRLRWGWPAAALAAVAVALIVAAVLPHGTCES